MTGTLYLENGTIYRGRGLGASATWVGELVFNTSMIGYEKILTDPSYNGQIITMTYPLVGNYGVCREDYESDRIYAKGFVVKDICLSPSNYRNENDVNSWLMEQGVPIVAGVDTRKITKTLRQWGTMKCVITTEDLSEDALKDLCEKTEIRNDYMRESAWYEQKPAFAESPHAEDDLSASQPNPAESTHAESPHAEDDLSAKNPKVAVIDLGIKKSILTQLQLRNCRLKTYPYGFKAEDLLADHPDGIFISNGPGDPKEALSTIEEVKKLTEAVNTHGNPIPIFGICMGHQILALAFGGDTYKLKFGHRGGNHGVYNKETDRAYITSQNHGYAVDGNSLGEDVIITEINLNDGTVEGMRHRSKPIFSVQYHPEASPGPEDSFYLFDKFMKAMEQANHIKE